MQPLQPLEWVIRPARPGKGNVLGLKVVDAPAGLPGGVVRLVALGVSWPPKPA